MTLHDQEPEAAAGSVILHTLMQRLDNAPGFVGIAATVNIVQYLQSDTVTAVRQITAAILHDPAFTANLIRLANAGAAEGREGRNVATIDQAFQILGINGIQNAAKELQPLHLLGNPEQIRLLEAETAAAHFCATFALKLARHLGTRIPLQETQVCALLQNIGRLLAFYYVYDLLLEAKPLQALENLSEDEAVLQYFGVDFEAIGAAVAQHWHWPDPLLRSLMSQEANAPPANTASGWQQLCLQFAKRITDTLFRLPSAREKAEVHRHLHHFQVLLGLKHDETLEWITQSLKDADVVLSELNFHCGTEAARTLLRKASERVIDTISAQDRIKSAALSDGGKKPIDLLRHALRMLHYEFSFDLTLLCMPDGSSGLVAVAGIGRDAQQVLPKFHCGGAKPDLFRLIMQKKFDVYVADIKHQSYAKLLPDWYSHWIRAQSFSLLSLVHQGKFLGLIYGDYSSLHPAKPQEKTAGALQKWRDQLMLALQAGQTPA